jgi:hypothetical protein
MLRIAINEAGSIEGSTKLRDIADALVSKAIEGDFAAIKEVADRIDGKVPQAIAGDPENPMMVLQEITRKIVHVRAGD